MRRPTTFIDAAGRQWKPQLPPDGLDQFKADTGVDLAATIERHENPTALFEEPERLVMLLWITCEGQARERGVSPEEFGRTLFAEPAADDDTRHPLDRFDMAAFQAAAAVVVQLLADAFPCTAFGLAHYEARRAARRDAKAARRSPPGQPIRSRRP